MTTATKATTVPAELASKYFPATFPGSDTAKYMVVAIMVSNSPDKIGYKTEDLPGVLREIKEGKNYFGKCVFQEEVADWINTPALEIANVFAAKYNPYGWYVRILEIPSGTEIPQHYRYNMRPDAYADGQDNGLYI